MRFVLIDEVVDLSPGKTIRAMKTMSPDEELFRDHYPGFPVVPGVLLTEMMAQATGKCLESENPDRGKPMLARILNANFRRWARPGQRLSITAEIRTTRPEHATADCRVETEGQLVAEAQLFFCFIPQEQFSPAEKAGRDLTRRTGLNA
jgi:3-hydroxyacyl-[acyl-carrier-protein] dehydratase